MLKMFLIAVILAVSFSAVPGHASSMTAGAMSTQLQFSFGDIKSQSLAPVSACKNAAARIGCASSPVLVPVADYALFALVAGMRLTRLYPAHERVEFLAWSPATPPPKWTFG